MSHNASTIQSDETTLTALVPIWDSGEETLVFPVSGQFNCGSHRENSAKISLTGVAERHCRLLCRGGEVKVEPFGQHKVWVNDVLVLGAQSLSTGDRLAVGPARFRVERRRAGLLSRVNVIDRSPKPPASLPATSAPIAAIETTSTAVNRQMDELERRLAEAQAAVVPALQPATPQFAPFSTISTMPILAGATQNNRRRLLDAREAQLTEWQSSLELRCAELDNRSTTLARQQALLSERQLEHERRANELEIWQDETSRTLRIKNEKLADESRREIEQQRAELIQRDEQLRRERADLDAQSQRLEASKQTVSAQLAELSEARRTLTNERQQYLKEQESVAADFESRESALQNQQQELEIRVEQVSDLEAVRDEVTRHAQALETQQAELDVRAGEFTELETRRQDVAEREAALRDLHNELDDRAAELFHLETIRGAVAQEKAELNALRVELEPEIAAVAQLENLSREIEEREAALQTQQAVVSREADELSTAVNEVAVERQRIENARQQLSTVDEQVLQLRAQEQDHATRQAQLNLHQDELNTLAEDLQAREASIHGAQSDLDVQGEKLQQLANDLAMQEAEIASKQEGLAESIARADEVSLLSQQLQRREAAASTLAEELIAERDGLTARSAELEQLAAQLSAQVEQTAAEDAAFDLRQRTADDSHAAALCELDTLRATLEEREAAITENAESLQVKADKLEQTAIASSEDTQTKIEALNQQVEDATSEAAVAVAERAELQVALSELRTALAESRETLAAASESAANDSTGEQLAELQTQVARMQLDVTEQEQLAEEAQSEAASLVAERDKLQTALNELRTAFESLRDELSARPTNGNDSGEMFAELQSQLTVRENELADAQRTVTEQQQLTDTLKNQLLQLTESFELERSRLRDEVAPSALTGADAVDGADLLRQIEELQSELNLANSAAGASVGVTPKIEQYEQTIAVLTTKLEEALKRSSATHVVSDGATDDDAVDQNRSMIEMLTQKLEEQNKTITTLQQPASEVSETSIEEMQTLHRELDERTKLLDTREEGLREQQRMAQQSGEELNQQRRAILEARQQLELARAEIQVASHRQDSVRPESLMSEREVEEVEEEEDYHDLLEPVEEEPPAVRSEIAELFGLGGGTPARKPSYEDSPKESYVTTAAQLMAAVDDYSQEQAAAVSMSFSTANDMLLAPVHDKADLSTDDGSDVEEAHDDFVSQYMEQLLSQNRAGAGGALPSELTKSTPPPAKAASSPPPPKAATAVVEKPNAPGQFSFIEQYMSGGFGVADDSVSDSRSDAPVTLSDDDTLVEVKPQQPRPKMDVEAMRKNMSSFRELSTKSVENALATHAKRQRRGGIVNRSTLFLTLGLICVLMVTASLWGAIPFGIFTWISIIVAVLAGADLMLKMGSSRNKGDREEDEEDSAAPVSAPAVALHQPTAAAQVEEEDQYFEL